MSTTHRIELARAHLDDVLTESPMGHRGLWATMEAPEWIEGDVLEFVVYRDVVQARGIVLCICPPGAPRPSFNPPLDDSMARWCIRFNNWYRTFWVEEGVAKPDTHGKLIVERGLFIQGGTIKGNALLVKS